MDVVSRSDWIFFMSSSATYYSVAAYLYYQM